MKNHARLLSLVVLSLSLATCSPPVDLTSSWTNKNVTPKSSPKIMVLALGKNLSNRQAAENHIVNELKLAGYQGVAALDVLNPSIEKYDSLSLVNILRQNKFDMILTNAVVDVKETQRYVPGTTETVPVATYPINGYPAYYGGYYNYYNYRMTYYHTVYETRTTPGTTVTDVEVLIESNLYDVATADLLWVGQSKSLTAEPSDPLFKAFAKNIVNDLLRNSLLRK